MSGENRGQMVKFVGNFSGLLNVGLLANSVEMRNDEFGLLSRHGILNIPDPRISRRLERSGEMPTKNLKSPHFQMPLGKCTDMNRMTMGIFHNVYLAYGELELSENV